MLEKIEKLKNDGKLTPYVHKQLVDKMAVCPEELKNRLIKDAVILSSIGVESEEDHKNFYYVFRHIRGIGEDLCGKHLDKEKLSRLSHIVFKNADKYPIDTIFNFYKAVANAFGELNISIRKIAYPRSTDDIRAQEPYNVYKWAQSMREIYALVHRGFGFSDAFNIITKDWDNMSQQKFKHWMRFYQEDAQNKYKTAAEEDERYYSDHSGAPLLPMDHLMAKLPPSPSASDVSQFVELNPAERAEEKKRREEEREERRQAKERAEAEQRREDVLKKIEAILGRLNSAERLISDPGVQEAMREGLDGGIVPLLRAVQDLKIQVQTAPARFAASSIFEDLIIRKGNILISDGFPKTGKCIKKWAQALTVDPMAGAGDEDEDAMKEFVQLLNYDIPEETEEEAKKVDDSDEAEDDQAEITVVAQAPPPAPVPAPLPEETPPTPEDVVVTPDMPMAEDVVPEIEVGDDVPTKKVTDLDVDLDSVTTADVVARLEVISNILKNREIPRQLSIIDLMMDRLGIASYFPALGEAQKSALESNQYMTTRIEEILSRLRGSLQPEEELDLVTTEGDAERTSDTLEAVKENLERAEEKEEELKEKRKQRREEAEVEESPPAVPIEMEELGAPVTVEKAPPARVAPAAPAAPAAPVPPAPIR